MTLREKKSFVVGLYKKKGIDIDRPDNLEIEIMDQYAQHQTQSLQDRVKELESENRQLKLINTNQIKQMERFNRDRELLLAFMRSLKAKGLLDMDIHGSLVDVFIHSELPRLNIPSN